MLCGHILAVFVGHGTGHRGDNIPSRRIWTVGPRTFNRMSSSTNSTAAGRASSSNSPFGSKGHWGTGQLTKLSAHPRRRRCRSFFPHPQPRRQQHHSRASLRQRLKLRQIESRLSALLYMYLYYVHDPRRGTEAQGMERPAGQLWSHVVAHGAHACLRHVGGWCTSYT